MLEMTLKFYPFSYFSSKTLIIIKLDITIQICVQKTIAFFVHALAKASVILTKQTRET